MNRQLTLLLRVSLMLAFGLLAQFTGTALAASINPVPSTDAGALALAQGIVSNLSTLSSAHFLTVPPKGTPHGVSNALSFFPTNGGTFAILTTGNALVAGNANTSPFTSFDDGGPLIPNRGNSAFDVTILQLNLNAPAGTNCLRFDFAFYSEEFPEFVGSAFNDAFIAELDKSTWVAGYTIQAPDNFAFDPDGKVISINSTGVTRMSDLNASGTTYDGATTLLQAAARITPGTHSLYLSIFDQGDHTFDSAVFLDNLRFETVANPDAQCRPGAEPKKKTPLILIPGIGGSKLVNDLGEAWPRVQDLLYSPTDEFTNVLRLAPDGISPLNPNDKAYSSVRPGDILRSETVHVGPIPYSEDFYATTINTLKNAGYQENVDLFIFPYYDWRKDVEGLGNRLLDYLDEVRTKTGTGRVDLMAHSMGGMVTRTALAQPRSVGKVRRVITLGTPILGAPKILGMLEYQTPCFTEVPLFGCITNPATAQAILTNFPSTYQIMPGPNYDKAEVSPLMIDRDTNGDGKPEGVQSYAQWSAIVREHRNAQLMNKNQQYHQAYDKMTLADPQVEFYRIIGSAVGTPAQIREYTSCFLWTFNCHVAYEVKTTSGDGTIPLHSADVYNPTRGVDYRNGIANAYINNVTHGDLPKNQAVSDFALSFFGTAPEAAKPAGLSSAATINGREPEALPADWPGSVKTVSSVAKLALESSALSDTPKPLSGMEVEVLGPLQAYVKDNADNLLGRPPEEPLAIYFSAVPGGTYYSIRDTQTYFLSQAGSYLTFFKVADQGGMRVRVRTYANDQLNGQAVFQVNAPVEAKLQLPFASGQALTALRLKIDRDGNGVIDQEVSPDSVITGPAASDQLPPSTKLALHLDTKRQCQLTLTAQDEPGGSGVAAIYYFLQGLSQQPGMYTSPVSFPCGTLVKYMSADRAGNMELIQTVQTVPLDIKPGSDPNSLNLGAKGNTPAAILSTSAFDASKVDVASITLAGSSIALKPNGTRMATFQDVNKDKRPDLVVHFATTNLQLTNGSTEALLRGKMQDGTPALGVDWVKIVP